MVTVDAFCGDTDNNNNLCDIGFARSYLPKRPHYSPPVPQFSVKSICSSHLSPWPPAVSRHPRRHRPSHVTATRAAVATSSPVSPAAPRHPRGRPRPWQCPSCLPPAMQPSWPSEWIGLARPVIASFCFPGWVGAVNKPWWAQESARGLSWVGREPSWFLWVKRIGLFVVRWWVWLQFSSLLGAMSYEWTNNLAADMMRLPTFDDSSELAAEGKWGRASWGKSFRKPNSWQLLRWLRNRKQ